MSDAGLVQWAEGMNKEGGEKVFTPRRENEVEKWGESFENPNFNMIALGS